MKLRMPNSNEHICHHVVTSIAFVFSYSVINPDKLKTALKATGIVVYLKETFEKKEHTSPEIVMKFRCIHFYYNTNRIATVHVLENKTWVKVLMKSCVLENIQHWLIVR